LNCADLTGEVVFPLVDDHNSIAPPTEGGALQSPEPKKISETTLEKTTHEKG